MQFILVCLSCIHLIHINFALICPIYSLNKPRSSQNHFIQNCDKNCTFYNVLDEQIACIGVYSNSSGIIMIKQLGTIQADPQPFTLDRCTLELDSKDPQSFSCSCSTDNCTLNWHIIPSTTTYRSIVMNKTLHHHIRITDEEHFSWRLFLILFTISMIIILIMFAFGLWKSIRNAYENDHNKSIIKQLSSSIETLFYSAEEINAGKNSFVYKAIWDDEIVAVKVYKQSNIFLWNNEISLLKSVKHEAIIKIITEGQYNSHLYLVLPFYECGTLESYLRTSNQRLSINQCLLYLHSLASAISYLHLGRHSSHKTIVHRDIKSSNILIDKNQFKIYLTDFGVAAALSQVLTERDFVQIGTVRYMAPELLEGVIAHTREALCSVDMYAFALVMWEIVTQCDAYPTTEYQLPYEEYRTNTCDKRSFANQIHDIVVVRRLRPSLIRKTNDCQNTVIIDELCSLIDACWITDSDMRMNAQTLAFKLNQLML